MVGEVSGTIDWVALEPQRIDLFADATGDHQWIHVDVERARAGPFGVPIAHGFLTVSLLPTFMRTACQVVNCSSGVNYGLDKVRFPTPVPAPVGSLLRACWSNEGLGGTAPGRRSRRKTPWTSKIFCVYSPALALSSP